MKKTEKNFVSFIRVVIDITMSSHVVKLDIDNFVSFPDVPRVKSHSSYDPERRWRVRRQRVRESHQWRASRVDGEGTSARD